MTSTPSPIHDENSETSDNSGGRILLADDEPALVAGSQSILKHLGFTMETASNGAEALALLDKHDFDLVVSDISMPGMDGLELLKAIHARDPDLPVIVMTGGPTLETAVKALEYGALRYLVKPVNHVDLEQAVRSAARLRRLARMKRKALEVLGAHDDRVLDHGQLEERFDKALDALWMAFQPIVQWSTQKIFGYEALVRSHGNFFAHPGELFDAAERLNRLNDLGRAIRSAVSKTIATNADRISPAQLIFVNLHPSDLHDTHLFGPDSPLSGFASQVVLEITERAPLDGISDVRGRIGNLRSMGFRVAIDDLGAGYAGLSSFAQLEPEVVKLDMSLVRDVHLQPTKAKLVRSLASLCQELGMLVVLEGIETVDERQFLTGIGCDLMQGFLFAKPGPAFPTVTWL